MQGGVTLGGDRWEREGDWGGWRGREAGVDGEGGRLGRMEREGGWGGWRGREDGVGWREGGEGRKVGRKGGGVDGERSEEHTTELKSR